MNYPTCKENFLNLLEISKKAESLPQNVKSKIEQSGSSDLLQPQSHLHNNASVDQPTFQYVKILNVNNSKESIISTNNHNAANQAPPATSSHNSQPLIKKKIKFVKKPDKQASLTNTANKSAGSRASQPMVNFGNHYNIVGDQLNSHTNSISSDHRVDRDSFNGVNNLLGIDNSATALSMAKAEAKQPQYVAGVYGSSNYNSANVQTNAEMLAEQHQL